MTGRVTLVTGFPTSFLATRMVRKILAEERHAQVRCVVQEKFLGRAREIVDALPVRDRERVTLLEGDVASMDMGLSGRERVELAGGTFVSGRVEGGFVTSAVLPVRADSAARSTSTVAPEEGS